MSSNENPQLELRLTTSVQEVPMAASRLSLQNVILGFVLYAGGKRGMKSFPSPLHRKHDWYTFLNAVKNESAKSHSSLIEVLNRQWDNNGRVDPKVEDVFDTLVAHCHEVIGGRIRLREGPTSIEGLYSGLPDRVAEEMYRIALAQKGFLQSD